LVSCATRAETDADVIKASLRDPERFALLYDRHHLMVHRYIARRLGGDAADDLMAETFLIAFKTRGRYDLTRVDARPWLYGIATNLVGRRYGAESRFWQLIARTGIDDVVEPPSDQVTDRVAAQACDASWRVPSPACRVGNAMSCC
jgi:DNA-directed RNA polymerase specialized sigma24 family protein